MANSPNPALLSPDERHMQRYRTRPIEQNVTEEPSAVWTRTRCDERSVSPIQGARTPSLRISASATRAIITRMMWDRQRPLLFLGAMEAENRQLIGSTCSITKLPHFHSHTGLSVDYAISVPTSCTLRPDVAPEKAWCQRSSGARYRRRGSPLHLGDPSFPIPEEYPVQPTEFGVWQTGIHPRPHRCYYGQADAIAREL